MIPKIIHQIWLQGYDNIPEDLKKYHENCKVINNDFEYIFWDDDKIRNFLNNNFGKEYTDIFDSYPVYAQKADFARYAILYHYGGIYLDMDTHCRKNLSAFLNFKLFITIIKGDIFDSNENKYSNAVIGTIPKHPLFLIIFKKILERKNTPKQKNHIDNSTGCRLFYDSVQEHIKTNKNDIAIIDPKYLHPCGILAGPDCMHTCQDCYIVHTNLSSWSPGGRFIKNVRNNIGIIIFILIIIIISMFFALRNG